MESILQGSFNLSIAAYVIKLGLSLLFQIGKIIKNPSLLLKLAADKDNLRFGMFTGSFVLIFRALLCLLRRYVREEYRRMTPLFAGAVAGGASCLFLNR